LFTWLCFNPRTDGAKGTNSPRLFTLGETKALAKSKVHQWSRALTNGVEWVVITDLKIWLFARSEEGKKIKKYM
jgi:predicted type IV restriction endonuclease